MFITFDGIDGGGKSTQIELLSEYLSGLGHSIDLIRDPGTTAAGEAIREIILNRTEIDIDPITEMLLYQAARAQLVRERIEPSLQAHRTVISDRFLLANLVYQGSGGGVPIDQIWAAGAIATAGRKPDFTVLLDLPVEVAQSRLGGVKDRLERRSLEYFERVRQGFLENVTQTCSHFLVVDAEETPEAIHASIVAALTPLL
jgi:dTMP kinase